MSDKFWAAAFTVVAAIGAVMVARMSALDFWLLLLLLSLVGGAWLLAIYRADQEKKREKYDARGTEVYRAALHSSTPDRATLKPSTEWLRQWRAAGMPDRFSADCE